MIKYLNVFLILIFSFNAEPSIGYLKNKIHKRQSFYLNDYLKKHKIFSQKLCRPGTEEKYWRLVKNYRGRGFFIPKNIDGSLDRRTIKKYLPEFDEKVKWLNALIESVEKENSFQKHTDKLDVFDLEIERLLLLKERYFDTSDQKQKKYLLYESKEHYKKLRLRVRGFLETMPFLHAFHFPNDHLKLRKEYDSYKKADEQNRKLKANQVYFYRKLVQDGAHDKLYKKSDTQTRMLIDTVYLALEKPDDFLREDIRFDIEAVFEGIRKQMQLGVRKQVARLKRWREKTKKAKEFYQSLYDGKVILDGREEKSEKFVKESNLARKALKDYVLELEAKTYRYWSKFPEIYRSLFVLTTIAYNEVGRVDGPDALERADVLDVVLNRFESSKYNNLTRKDQLLPYLKWRKDKIKRFPWLNVLFKESEFSFTYYFIPGSLRIFCPEMTKSGRSLRRKNTRLALKQLRDSGKRFNAIRYFSRASMLGRIDMSSLWSGYRRIAERRGRRIPQDKKLKALFKKNRYKYFYHFSDPKGDRFKTVKIGNTMYAVRLADNSFYTYRNPHYFRYFSRKD